MRWAVAPRVAAAMLMALVLALAQTLVLVHRREQEKLAAAAAAAGLCPCVLYCLPFSRYVLQRRTHVPSFTPSVVATGAAVAFGTAGSIGVAETLVLAVCSVTYLGSLRDILVRNISNLFLPIVSYYCHCFAVTSQIGSSDALE